MALRGHVDLMPKAVRLDMDVDADVLDEGLMRTLLENRDKKAGQDRKPGKWDVPVQGAIRIRANDLKYRTFTWHPLHANVSFKGDRMEAVVEKAKICGISTLGRLEVTPQEVSVDMKLISKKEKLHPALACIMEGCCPASHRKIT